MPRFLTLVLLMLCLLAGAARAQEKPDHVTDISGAWHSSSGARVSIANANYGPGNRFEIVATSSGGRQTRYSAVWEGGFRQTFIYKTADGDKVIGIVMPDGSSIRLANSPGTWKAAWTR